MPIKRTKKSAAPSKRSKSVWHEEAHPSLTHGAIAIFAFLGGVILLGAVGANAETSSSPTRIAVINEVRTEVQMLSQRVEALELRLDAKQDPTHQPFRNIDCEVLKNALPTLPHFQRIPSSVECIMAPGVNQPGKKFRSASAIYRYGEGGSSEHLTIQIYDLGTDERAKSDFLSKGAYLPVDYDRVNREDTEVAGLLGTFTYDGIPNHLHKYPRGANWFLLNNRYGITIHGSPIGFTDRTQLDLLTAASIQMVRISL
ncbi:hypothetical protein GF380_01255 [Candidatus Uhrbacteria bacterium]|nr:hypothetical protein [Candidatus Uhrbacteria bacterium]MBD3283912.1 hypothetical protein [Candidatus Uhrbacteria bacterium]